MKVIIIILSLLMSVNIMATEIKDVKVLDIKSDAHSFELKLETTVKDKKTHFYVDIGKSDEQSFEKLGLVIKKLQEGDKLKLNLEIPSFSPFPSGSFYKSQSVRFSSDEKE